MKDEYEGDDDGSVESKCYCQHNSFVQIMKFDEGGEGDDADNPHQDQVLDAFKFVWIINKNDDSIVELCVESWIRYAENVQGGDGAAEDHHEHGEADHKLSHALIVGELLRNFSHDDWQSSGVLSNDDEELKQEKDDKDAGAAESHCQTKLETWFLIHLSQVNWNSEQLTNEDNNPEYGETEHRGAI